MSVRDTDVRRVLRAARIGHAIGCLSLAGAVAVSVAVASGVAWLVCRLVAMAIGGAQ